MGKGARAKRKLRLEMSAACKGGRNVHELCFPLCVRQGGKERFEQKLSLSRTVVLSANVHACGRQCNFPLIALQLIRRGSEQLFAASSVQAAKHNSKASHQLVSGAVGPVAKRTLAR